MRNGKGGSRFWFLSSSLLALPFFSAAMAAAPASLPSLFRGVVVAEGPLGVRVVSIEESSQAHEADLRPEDVIVRIQDAEVRSIDEFAALSLSLKDRGARAVALLIFRNGEPLEIPLHLYSYPILREWHLAFVPDFDIRFAEPSVGLSYWMRLGRGFEEANKSAEALEAYLNGLHNAPTDAPTAMKVSSLFLRLSRRQLSEKRLSDGINSMRQALIVLERLFDHPLSDEQLEAVRRQLSETLHLLRETTAAHPKEDRSEHKLF